MSVPFSYSNWRSGEPNDHKGEPEDCVEFMIKQGWNDVPCSVPLRYICEYDPSGEEDEQKEQITASSLVVNMQTSTKRAPSPPDARKAKYNMSNQHGETTTTQSSKLSNLAGNHHGETITKQSKFTTTTRATKRMKTSTEQTTMPIVRVQFPTSSRRPQTTTAKSVTTQSKSDEQMAIIPTMSRSQTDSESTPIKSPQSGHLYQKVGQE